MQQEQEILKVAAMKVAKRFATRGSLSGTMKLGQELSADQLRQLYSFFGVTPLRINSKEEVRLDFAVLLQSGSETEWIEKVTAFTGRNIEPKRRTKKAGQLQQSVDRLRLAFPELQRCFDSLLSGRYSLSTSRKKQEGAELNDTLFRMAETLFFIHKNSAPVTLSELGARFFNDSKILRQGELQRLLLDWLRILLTDDPDLALFASDENIWSKFHIIHDHLTVNAVLYGPVVYEKNGVVFDWIDRLYRQGEAATIGWSNLEAMDSISFKTPDATAELLCIENEAPFSQLMLRQRPEQPARCLLFTCGFPGAAVKKLYTLLAPQATRCRHWGDSDPAGLRIASILHAIHPLQLFRCDCAALSQHRTALIPLTAAQKQAGASLLSASSSFPFSEELKFTLENGWLEQESWREN